MVSEIDGSKLVKVYWSDVRKRVAKIEPTFASIVDELDPKKSFPLYIAYYSYGDVIADPFNMYLPSDKGKKRKIDQSSNKDIKKDLGYGDKSLAMGMVLDKEIEVFIDLENEGISIPWLIYKPGTFFPFAKTLSIKCNRTYSPNNILTIVSGARSAFMLPNIGCLTNHVNLQRDFNIQSGPPKQLYQHWEIFREIVHSDVIKCDWQSCLLFFSEKWLTALHTDKAWLKLKMYLHELAWHHFEFRRNSIYYDIAFSVIQKKRNLRPNPYLADTANHLFMTSLGSAPGFAPAIDERALPLKILQNAFVQSYGMKKYYPTIMQPSHFMFEVDKYPVYYSLQNPSTFVFSPKSRKISSTLFEMHELRHLMKIFIEELAKDNTIGSGTIISEVANKVNFNYFHNEVDRHKIITHSKHLINHDDRFISNNTKCEQANFASDAKFLRGCIAISSKI